MIITSANSLIIKMNALVKCANASELVSEVESFSIDSIIRVYHVYKDVWYCFIGKVLSTVAVMCTNATILLRYLRERW